ncbi:hypothetical protein WMF27_27505 [Sorangium sp. So ce281]|uniref:hypothetical protein n=1 Tax=Sorangium sp. So ce281 TaxID=3133293 RepID=UPI003F640F31
MLRPPVSFQARAMCIGLCCAALACMAPPGLKGVLPFLASPAGLGVAALALMALGTSIEDLGRIRRIRVGVGLCIVAAALVAAGALWGAALPALKPSLAWFAWPLYGAGAIGVALALRRDIAVFRDPRHGQSVRLESISADAVRLTANGAPVTVPAAQIRGVSLCAGLEGRGVFVLVGSRDKVIGDARALPWVAAHRDGDTFLLTEHQAALDAEVLAVRLHEAASASGGDYR